MWQTKEQTMEQTSEKKFEPSVEQLTAINYSHTLPDGKERSAVVTAAAGSGKTTLLVERIIRLLTDRKLEISADSLAIMTFTKNATASMREKLNNALAEKLETLSGAKTAEELETYEHLKEQLFKLRQATISTIDAFCLRMIRENAEVFDLPLNISIADSAKKASLQGKAMRSALQDFYDTKFSDKERDLLFYTFNFEDDSELEKAILSIYEKLSTHPDPEKWMSDTLEAYKNIDTVSREFLPLLNNYLKFNIRRAELIVKEYSDKAIYTNLEKEFDDNYKVAYDKIPKKDKISKTNQEKLDKIVNNKNEVLPTIQKYIKYDEERVNTLVSDFNDYEKAMSAALFHEMIKKLADSSDPAKLPEISGKAPNYKNKKLFTKTKNALRDAIEKLLKLCSDVETNKDIISETQSAMSSFFKLLRLFSKYYSEEKTKAGCMDFSDCERELFNKLSEDGGNNDFRKQLSERFKCVIVDEFQDSNKIQAEIFRLLGDGHLFYVGDVKQSIYAFRGADPTIMADMCREDNTEFETLPLSMNYRSRQAVIKTVNASFTGLMTREHGGVDYSREQLRYYDNKLSEQQKKYENEKSELYGTDIYLLHSANSGENNDDDASDKDMTMPRFVAKKIKELHDNKDFRVSDKNSVDRPAEYSDFYILIRKKAKIKFYRKALAELGIPSAAPKGLNFFEADEVLLAYNYLKVIDNPMLNEEMLKVLMSPIYRFTAEEVAQIKMGILGLKGKSDEELKSIAAKYKKRSLFSCIYNYIMRYKKDVHEENNTEDNDVEELEDVEKGEMDPILPKLEKFYNELKEFRYYMNSNSLENLVSKVYEDTDLLAVVSAFENSAGRVENVRQLQRLAANFEADRGGGLGDFLRFFDRAKENASGGIEEAAIPESSANAVRIMTFHGSKGLEAPICIMVEMQKKENNQDYSGNLLMSFEHYMAIKHTDIKRRRKTKTLPYLALSQFIREQQLGDELRLMYVAMTRARDKLIMVSTLSKDDYKDFGSFVESNAVNADPDLRDEVYEKSTPFKCVLSMLLGNKHIVNDTECLILEDDVDSTDSDDENRKAFCRITAINEKNEGPADAPVASADDDIPEDKVREISELLKLKYDYPEDTRQKAKYTATELAHNESVKRVLGIMTETKADAAHNESVRPVILTKPTFKNDGGNLGVKKGNAYHHCMMHFPIEMINVGMSLEDAVKAVNKALDELKESHKLTADERDIVDAEHIARFFIGELGQRMIKAYLESSDNVKREQPFFAEINGREVGLEYNDRISIQGQVDMYFIENGEIILVDYKSDRPENLAKEKESYKLQVKIYNMILKKLTGMEVKDMALYAFLTDEVIYL